MRKYELFRCNMQGALDSYKVRKPRVLPESLQRLVNLVSWPSAKIAFAPGVFTCYRVSESKIALSRVFAFVVMFCRALNRSFLQIHWRASGPFYNLYRRKSCKNWRNFYFLYSFTFLQLLNGGGGCFIMSRQSYCNRKQKYLLEIIY